MTDTQILAQFDNTGRVIVQILVALFLTLSCIVALVFAVFLTSFVLSWLAGRKMLVLILSHRQTRAAFALVGGCL